MTPPSNFILRISVEEDQKLVRTPTAHYADAAADSGLEPAERLDSHGPRTGGMVAVRRFMADLQDAMIITRLKVDLMAVA